jgi:uncharacterized membrane protein YedE/YeeE
MSDVSFKAFGVFCFSVICFGGGTAIAGMLASCDGDSDETFLLAWLIGSITFGIAMVIAYG